MNTKKIMEKLKIINTCALILISLCIFINCIINIAEIPKLKSFVEAGTSFFTHSDQLLSKVMTIEYDINSIKNFTTVGTAFFNDTDKLVNRIPHLRGILAVD
jgi:hypothetical protein